MTTKVAFPQSMGNIKSPFPPQTTNGVFEDKYMYRNETAQGFFPHT